MRAAHPHTAPPTHSHDGFTTPKTAHARTTLPSPLPQLDAPAPVHASAPPPACSGFVHRRRRTAISVIHASEPHPRTGDAALILSERPAPHPPPNGALPPSGAPPSSRRGFVLSRSGFLPQVAIRFVPPFLPSPIRVLAPPAAGCWPTLACPHIQRDAAQCSRRCSTRPIRPPIAVDPPQPAFGSGDSPLAQGPLLFLRLISRRPLNIMVAALEVFH